MNHLILYVGIPGSGKTTHAEETARLLREDGRNVRIFSSDAIREEIYGDANIVGNAGEVFGLMENRLFAHFTNDPDSVAIYDATNLTVKGRKGLLDRIRRKFVCYFECRFVACRISECKRRQFSRDRKVPDYVIERMVRQFQAPFYNEGWDEITIVEGGPLYNLTEEHSDSWDIPHDNPHHARTIGSHMAAARREALVLAGDYDDSAVIAAYNHDIGKPHTKGFANAKGEPTEDAHYYGHESVSAYMYLSSQHDHKFDSIKILTGALIQWHMMPYFITPRGETPKKEDLAQWCSKHGFAEDFIDKLWIVHQADQGAH